MSARCRSWWTGPAEQVRRGQVLLIYSTASPDAVQNAQRELGRSEAAAILEQAFGALAVALAGHGVRAFVVAGGETSGAVLEALGVRMLGFGEEIEPGVPWTRSLDPEGFSSRVEIGEFRQPGFFRQGAGDERHERGRQAREALAAAWALALRARIQLRHVGKSQRAPRRAAAISCRRRTSRWDVSIRARLSKLDSNGRHVDGPPPTKEAWLHIAMYKARPDDAAVVHLHSTYATALVVSDRSPGRRRAARDDAVRRDESGAGRARAVSGPAIGGVGATISALARRASRAPPGEPRPGRLGPEPRHRRRCRRRAGGDGEAVLRARRPAAPAAGRGADRRACGASSDRERSEHAGRYRTIPGRTRARRRILRARAAAGERHRSNARRPARSSTCAGASANPAEVFLYEIYDDESAFAAHLKTPHFLAFDADSPAPGFADKVVEKWERA